MSAFRTPVNAKALYDVIRDVRIKENLRKLVEKNILQKQEDYYYLHDVLRDFFYMQIDNPETIHQSIGEYYASQKREKRDYDLVEGSHHLIKGYGKINDQVVDYFLSMPNNTYVFFIVNEILKREQNIIDASEIFKLFDRFIESKNIQIVNDFILSYGYYFDKIYNNNKPEKSFQVYHKILQLYQTEEKILDAVSSSVSKIAENHPKKSVEIWRKVVEINPCQ